jgi:hypothetical protein
MNEKRIIAFLIPALLVPLAIMAIVNILSGGGNQLGNTFNILMYGSALVGLLAPKQGMLLFVILQFYVDYFKRLLIIGDSLSLQDVMISLGLGPIIVIAACITCTIRWMSGKMPFMNLRDITFFFGCIAVSLLGIAIGGNASAASTMATIGQNMLGTAMLGMTAYASYVIFRTRESTKQILFWMVLGAVPMALYTIYQVTFGITGWEEKYIRTGMSQTLYGFYYLDGIKGMRPFSTLNTHTSVGAVSGVLFLVCTLIMARDRAMFEVKKSKWLAYAAVSLLFLTSCLLSRSRATYLLPIFGFALCWLFRGGIRTILFYAISAGSFVWMVVYSEFLNSQILDWTVRFESTALGRKVGSIGTYQDRLKSLISLSEPRNWSPFGLPENARPFIHDQITEVVVKLGYVPLIGIIIVVIFSATWWHYNCLKIKDMGERSLVRNISAIIVSLAICGLAYGNMLFVAPVNSILGIFIGLGMGSIYRSKIARKTPVPVQIVIPVHNNTPDGQDGVRQRHVPSRP